MYYNIGRLCSDGMDARIMQYLQIIKTHKAFYVAGYTKKQLVEQVSSRR